MAGGSPGGPRQAGSDRRERAKFACGFSAVSGPLHREDIAGIVVLTLDEPDKRNALTIDLRERLLAELRRVEADPAVRAIVLTGAGNCFSSGGDITAMRGDDLPGARTRLKILQDVVRLLVAGRKPVVTAVRGAAFGGGFSLALAGDVIVADDSARFCASFGKVGLMADMGLLWTLPQRIGVARTRQIVMDARVIDCTAACDLGIVDVRVTAEDLDAAAMDQAERCASLAPLPIGFTKAIVARRAGSLEDVLEAELDAQAQLFATHDHREAREAFMEKRQPHFAGS